MGEIQYVRLLYLDKIKTYGNRFISIGFELMADGQDGLQRVGRCRTRVESYGMYIIVTSKTSPKRNQHEMSPKVPNKDEGGVIGLGERILCQILSNLCGCAAYNLRFELNLPVRASGLIFNFPG